MIIVYWTDFTCPFCYIAENRLHMALEKLGLQKETKMVFKAFELNPTSSNVPKRTVIEGFMRHYYMSEDQARAQVGRIENMARADGLEFNYGTARVTSTFDGLRVAKFAQSKSNDLANAFVYRMYQAFFGENKIMADRAVIVDCAVEVGLDKKEVEDVLESGAFTDEVRRDENQAHGFGISAVPYMVINDRYAIPGAIDMDDMIRVLKRAYDEEEAESVEGMVCGPDGCHKVE